MLDRGSDDLEDLMVLPCQVWFDTEVPEGFERDGLDTTTTTEQHLRKVARSQVRIESPREISASSKFLNTSVGTEKVEGEFAVRNVTKLTDAAGQLTDEGGEARLSEADGPARSVESAERILRLLRSKRSLSELKDLKGEYVTTCDEQWCEQESSQARLMDRGEIEVEEERRVRAKRVPVLPTDKEKDESEIVHMTIRSQCETEDSHKCSPTESLVPRVTMDRGSHAHDVYTGPFQRIDSAVETCQVLHESPQTRAVNGVLENLDTCGLGEVLLKRDVGSAIRILVDPTRVGRGERTMAEKCSKYLHQSNGMSENGTRRVETSATTSDCELPEWSRCKTDSENIAPSRIVGCAVHVLSQSEKRKDDRNVCVRLRTRKSRAELTQTSETVNTEDVRDEMAKLDPSKTTETALDRTDEDGERLPQRRTPNACTNLAGVPRNPRELTEEPMTENRKKYMSKSLTQRPGETPGSREFLGASSRHTTGRRASLDRAAQFEAAQHIHQTGTKRGAEDQPMFSSAKRAHVVHPPDPVAVAC